MRRLAPRGLGAALEGVLPALRPATTLARVQEVWPEVAGPGLSAAARPVSERRGTVTVSCGSSVWAQELALLSGDLLNRLNARLGEGGGAPAVEALRFVAAGRGARS